MSSVACKPPVPLPKRWDTRELFGTTREIELVHAGVVYWLRITQQNKLILNK